MTDPTLPERLEAIADDGEGKYPITDYTIREAAAALPLLLDVADAAQAVAAGEKIGFFLGPAALDAYKALDAALAALNKEAK